MSAEGARRRVERVRVGPLAAEVVAKAERIAALAPPWTDPEPAAGDPADDAWLARQWDRAIPPVFRAASTADLDEFTTRALRPWIDPGRPPNALVLGPTGTGKSHTAVAVLRPAHLRRLTIAFWPVARFLRDIGPGAPRQRDAWEAACWSDRLVLDDLGAERATGWAAEQLFSLLNERWMHELPTIATSNLELNVLRETVDGRVFSRLVGDDAIVVTMRGRDRRLT